MLWKKKQKLEKIESDIQIQKELQEITKKMEKVYAETFNNGKVLKKYSYSMDEVIDMMGQIIENKKEERKVNMEEQIHRLREVILYYQEQTYRVNQILLEDENWNSSVQIMKKEENIKFQSNGMSAINTIDSAFTFELHEAIEIVDTEFPERDGKIAVIHVPGLIDQGKVIRKAKVAVYYYSGNETKIPVEKGDNEDANGYWN